MKKFICISIISSIVQIYAFTLGENWVLRSQDGEVRINADIPSTVKMALFKRKLIPDPYYSTQNEGSQWVEKKVWIYEKTFDLKKKKGRRYFLKIWGVAPLGEVFFNGSLLGRVEGMFAQPIWEITDLLREKSNKLEIRLEPERERTRAIACQMSYGWDFAPRIIPIGVWRPVEIIESGDVLLKHPFLKLVKLEKRDALLNLSLEYDSKIRGKGKFLLRIKGKNFSQEWMMEKEVELLQGEGKWEFNFSLPSPRLWYPLGYGEQNLYDVSISLYTNKSLSHLLVFTWGARLLEWEKNPNSSELYGWIPKINGIKIYCKGANWVPVDSLFDLSRERYERLVQLAKSAGVNMFRIWGGGIIEEDYLYELCDRYGILLWQEFPLACADYPHLPSKAFLENAKDSILRLRNHPSLVLWCGGNEFDPDNQSNKPLIDALDKICQTLDGTRPFHRASPYGGDVHDWSVWHGSAPYTNYRQFCVFRSEAGLQAPPIKSDLEKFIPPKALFPPSQEWSYHLADAGKIGSYAKTYGSIESLEQFVKKAQLTQAITYQFNIDSCLKNMWANSGCLIWQFNDPWPNISWSMVDWYGNPKPSFYWFKKASQPINLAVDYDKTKLRSGEEIHIRIYAINQTPKVEDCEVVFLIASDEKVLKQLRKHHTFKPQQAEILWDFTFQLNGDYDRGVIFLIAKIFKRGKLVADKVYPITVERVYKPSGHIKALVIVSSLGREAEEWREIRRGLEPLGINLDIASPDNLPSLEDYQCFIIGESERIGEKLGMELMDKIAQLVSEGRGLLLDGGWNAFAEGGLKNTLVEEISPVLMKESSLRQDINLGIVVRDEKHPLLKGLSFEGVKIGGYNEEIPKSDAKVLLLLSNNAPLLVERGYGKGRCLAYTSGLRGGWSGALRLWDEGDIFIARMLAYLGGRTEEIEKIKREATGLDGLKESKLGIIGKRNGNNASLIIRNSSSHIAFFIEAEVQGLSTQPLFSDNYFTLLPGEEFKIDFSLPSGEWKIRVKDWTGVACEITL